MASNAGNAWEITSPCCRAAEDVCLRSKVFSFLSVARGSSNKVDSIADAKCPTK
jgi:hypothetical protein